MLFRKIAAGVVAALALLLTACGGPIQGRRHRQGLPRPVHDHPAGR